MVCTGYSSINYTNGQYVRPSMQRKLKYGRTYYTLSSAKAIITPKPFNVKSDPFVLKYAFAYSTGGDVTLKNGIVVHLSSPHVDSYDNMWMNFTLSNGAYSISYWDIEYGSGGTWVQETGIGEIYDYNVRDTVNKIRIYDCSEYDYDYFYEGGGYDESYVQSQAPLLIQFIKKGDNWYYVDYTS